MHLKCALVANSRCDNFAGIRVTDERATKSPKYIQPIVFFCQNYYITLTVE
jgi:hypothetical protein